MAGMRWKVLAGRGLVRPELLFEIGCVVNYNVAFINPKRLLLLALKSPES
jgi:hypothetical protein